MTYPVGRGEVRRTGKAIKVLYALSLSLYLSLFFVGDANCRIPHASVGPAPYLDLRNFK